MNERTDASDDAPAPGAKRRALADEQAHLDRVHDRVERVRERAGQRVAAASADRSGSTFQARFERDVTAHHHASRASRYTFGDVESLVFGRVDLADADTLHIGRVSVIDDDGDAILVDWRAPAAAPFYQATAATPMGVARRRTLVTRGRSVQDLDDELLDADAADELGLVAVTGQGALLAALSRERTGQMRDIVATIQAEQDRIIRAPATGTLVVTGGPGTGKTVVALHRVASLLYRDRERFEGRGVLVIGPSSAFTEYTSRVLPALGEDRAVQRPLSGLAPRGAVIQGWDTPTVALCKGELAMVELCRRLLAASLPPIPPATRVSYEGTTVSVGAAELVQVRDIQLGRVRPDRVGASYHDRTEDAERAMRDRLWHAWRRAHRQAGGQVSEQREATGFDAALDELASVTMLRRCYWPERDPTGVLATVTTGDVDLRELADGLLTADDARMLANAWATAEDWTMDDVALLDELAALLGTPPSRRQVVRERVDEGLRVTADTLRVDVEPVDVEAEDYRDFAHVVVDEAQDLTPMQWRAVARRGPYASWTVVGDLAQRGRLASAATWEEIAALLGRRDVRIESLRVNYRTPAEIAALGTAVLVAAGHDAASAPEAVRSTGEHPRLVATDARHDVVLEVVAELVAARDGLVAVLCPAPQLALLDERLSAALPAERDRFRVLDPRSAKGLEFDDVVVVDPDVIASGDEVGPHQLYVAVTRATRSLTLVASPRAQVPGAHLCVRERR